MTHRYHPDPARGDPPDAIVWDDCEDCDQRAMLWGLDQNNTRRAISLMLAAERGYVLSESSRRHYLTLNERELCSRLSAAYLAFERVGLLARTVGVEVE